MYIVHYIVTIEYCIEYNIQHIVTIIQCIQLYKHHKSPTSGQEVNLTNLALPAALTMVKSSNTLDIQYTRCNAVDCVYVTLADVKLPLTKKEKSSIHYLDHVIINEDQQRVDIL